MGDPQVIGLPAPPVAPSTLSALDTLVEDFRRAQDQHETVELDIPARKGWSAEYVTDIPYDMIAIWRKQAWDSALGLANEAEQAKLLLAFACRKINLDGSALTDKGQLVTFQSRELLERFDATEPTEVVKALLVKDPHIIATAQAVLKAAGYGEEVRPTVR